MKNDKTMTLEECDGCKYLIRLIGLGLGVRCTHPDNQKYKLKEELLPHLPLIITRVPINCPLKETREKEGLK